MEFRTIVDIPESDWKLEPMAQMLFVGSCFADNMGRRFQQELFGAVVNPYGVMYNPASVMHSVDKFAAEWEQTPAEQRDAFPQVAVLTMGTNHVYRLRQTGEIVDNCQKRPQSLFDEELLTIDECAGFLRRSIQRLSDYNPLVRVVLTVSPIRYRKYGYHGSQLSKSTLLIAVDQIVSEMECATYFPSYEIVNDELRDYRFYASDMLHPSEQAVEYIYQRFGATYFSESTISFLRQWQPIQQALNHKPFNPESPEYKYFREKAEQQKAALIAQFSHGSGHGNDFL